MEAGAAHNALPPVVPRDIVFTPIASLRPFDKGVNICFTVLAEVEPPKEARDGNWLWTLRVADASASIIANLWNAQGAAVRFGDVLVMASAYVTMFRGHMRVACKLGTTVRVGHLCAPVSTALDMSLAVHE